MTYVLCFGIKRIKLAFNRLNFVVLSICHFDWFSIFSFQHYTMGKEESKLDDVVRFHSRNSLLEVFSKKHNSEISQNLQENYAGTSF